MKKRDCPSSKRKEITVEIDLLPLISVALIVLMGIFLFFSAMDFIKGFIGVRKFEVVGECPYEASELAAGADIKKGDKLYHLDTKSAEQSILLNCAYVEKVDIKRSFPNKIKFVVDSYEPVWYVEISGDFYVLDKDLRVLEETKNAERLYEEGIVRLTLPKIKTAIVGENLSFGSSEGEIGTVTEIMETILKSDAFVMICSADIDNRYDIHFEFDKLVTASEDAVVELEDVFEVNVGGYQKLEAKLEYIVRAIMREDITGVCGGVIDVSDGGEKVSIRPIYVN